MEINRTVKKKTKSPWWGLIWIGVWTAVLVLLVYSEMFNTRELVGLTVAWLTLTGTTIFLLIQYELKRRQQARLAQKSRPAAGPPALNAPCPCGSGKKYKRCCGAVRGNLNA